MNTAEQVMRLPLAELLIEHPYAVDFLSGNGLADLPGERSFVLGLETLSAERFEDMGVDREELAARLVEFIDSMQALAGQKLTRVDTLRLIGGRDKKGLPEQVDISVYPGEITCIVGPTGSGKSRLLGDIEWMAQGDTPTGRVVLVNGAPVDAARRFRADQKLVAQLSQNMNFVMDLSVDEFLCLHAESRLAANPAELSATILELANELAGESFSADTALTSLSGGQSRALMIADTALLSASPIVLIDEIENAGIDRQKALSLLTDSRKIVFMATHDPILALLGTRRLVIGNGAIIKVIDTSPSEREHLSTLQAMDRHLADIRAALRAGERIEGLTPSHFSLL